MPQVAVGLLGAAVGYGAASAGWVAVSAFTAASIGFTVGSTIGGLLFQPDMPSTEGARLDDTSGQTANYGDQINKVWGSARVAGTIIWMPELEENGTTIDDSVYYSYFLNAAVGLSEGEILGVRRLWYDGKPLTPDGDNTLSRVTIAAPDATEIAVYLGSETQTADPNQEATEGAGNVPGYRGIAYVSIDSLALADYGNSNRGTLTAEVERLVPEVPTHADVADFAPTFVAGTAITESLAADAPADEDRFTLAPTGYYRHGMNHALGVWETVSGGDAQVMGLALFRSWKGDAHDATAYWEATQTELTGAVTDGGFAFALGSFDNSLVGFRREAAGMYFFLRSDWLGEDAFIPLMSVDRATVGLEDDHGPVFCVRGEHMFVFGVTATGRAVFRAAAYFENEEATFTFEQEVEDQTTEFDSEDEGNWVIVAPTETTVSVSFAPTFVNVLDVATGGGDYGGDLAFWAVCPGGTHGYALFDNDLLVEFTIDDADGTLVESRRLAFTPASAITYTGADPERLFTAPMFADRVGRVYVYDETSEKLFCIDLELATCRTVGTLTGAGAIGYSWAIYNGFMEWMSAGTPYRARFYTTSKNQLELGTLVHDICRLVGLTDAQINCYDLEEPIHGFALSSTSSAESAIRALQQLYLFDLPEIDGVLVGLARGRDPVAVISSDDLGAHEFGGDSGQETLVITTTSAYEIPDEQRVTFLNPDRDYNSDTQYYRRTNVETRNVESLSTNAIINDLVARQQAEALLFSRWQARRQCKFTTTVKYLYLTPGDVVTVNGASAAVNVRLTGVSFSFPALVQCEGVVEDAEAFTSYLRNSTRGYLSGPTSVGSTQTLFLDIPAILSSDLSAVGFYFAAWGRSPAWRGCLLYASIDDGATYEAIKLHPLASTVGVALDTLATGTPGPEDYTDTVDIRLEQGSLSTTDDAGLYAGKNMAAFGRPGRWEIVQFRSASLQMDGSYRLSGLLRALRGTEDYMGLHEVGDWFVLLDEKLTLVERPQGEIGLVRKYKAVSLGQNLASASVQGVATMPTFQIPLAPINVVWARTQEGGIRFGWTRRGRGPDYTLGMGAADQPLAEAYEAYAVRIYWNGALSRQVDRIDDAQYYEYTAAQQVEDLGEIKDSFTVHVYQISDTVGWGRPAIATIG